MIVGSGMWRFDPSPPGGPIAAGTYRGGPWPLVELQLSTLTDGGDGLNAPMGDAAELALRSTVTAAAYLRFAVDGRIIAADDVTYTGRVILTGPGVVWPPPDGELAIVDLATLEQPEPGPGPTVPVWATVDDVRAWLGQATTDTVDDAVLAQATDAANTWAWLRRQAAGYVDDPAISPGPDVTQGVLRLAAMEYRQRGSLTDYAGFDGFGGGGPLPGELGTIMRWLGVPRAQVY